MSEIFNSSNLEKTMDGEVGKPLVPLLALVSKMMN